jgi:hypothetical protein
MMHIDYPGCEQLAWDGQCLYAASDWGWCSRLLPDRCDIIGGKRRSEFSNRLLEAKGDTLLVGRSMLPQAAAKQTLRSKWVERPDRFVCRVGCQNSVSGDDGTVFLEDPALLNLSVFERPPANSVRFDERYDQAVLWDEAHVLLANRREALLFDLAGQCHRPVVFVADGSAGRRQLARPTDRGVIQVVSDMGGWVAMLEGGTLTRLSMEGGEAVLGPTTVRRTDSAVDSCQVADGRVLFVRRDGSATVVDRATNADLLSVPTGSGAVGLAPDGRTLATAAGECLNLVSVDKPATMQTFHIPGDTVRHIAFAPDGLTVAVATAAGATVFDVG